MRDYLVHALVFGGVIACLLGIRVSLVSLGTHDALSTGAPERVYGLASVGTSGPGTGIADQALQNVRTALVSEDMLALLAQEVARVPEQEVGAGEASVVVSSLRCPFTPQMGRTIVDFTQGGTRAYTDIVLTADGSEREAERAQTVSIVPGRYTIRLASYDTHAARDRSEYREVWSLGLVDGAGTVQYTDVIRDIRDSEELVVETVEKEYLLSTSIMEVIARHGAFPEDHAQDLAPLCAVFDWVGDVPAEMQDSVGTEATASPVNTGEAPSLSQYPRCPFTLRAGRTIIDFTRGGTVPLRDLVVSADATEDAAIKGPVASALPSGTYVVRLASFGGKAFESTYPGQTWRLEFYDAERTIVGATPASRDVPDWNTDFASLVSESFHLPTPSTSVRAVHDRYPSGSDGPVGVVCAALDRVGASSDESGRLILAENLDSASSSYGTSTHAGSDESSLMVIPREIGIESAFRTIRVASPAIAAARRAMAQEVDGSLFQAFLNARRTERERLMATLLHAVADSTTVATSTLQTISLVRMSSDDTERSDPSTTLDAVTPGEEGVRVFTERSGMVATRDTDGDGVTDYDEEVVYGTDPEQPFSAGDVLSDGERILLGLDPHATGTELVVTESPRVIATSSALFVVTHVSTIGVGASSTSSEHVPVRVQGMAPPLSFVTIYMYSTSTVMTVRADPAGFFECVFEEGIDDGDHAVYVASVNGSGKILVRSEPVSFSSTAGTITVTPATLPSVDPTHADAQTGVTMVFLLMLLAALSTIVGIGVHTAQHHSCNLTAHRDTTSS